MLTLNIKTAKKFFFDRQKIIDRIGTQRANLLRNVGGFVSKTAARSMRKKGYARNPPKKTKGKAWKTWQAEIRGEVSSKPGSPPFSHSTDPKATLRNILFIYDTSKEAMVVGPEGLNQKNAFGISGTVPSLHEYGGTSTVREKLVSFTDEEIIAGPTGRDSKGKFTKAPRRIIKGRRWVPAGKRQARPGQPTRRRKATYQARPFMAPAVAKTQSTGKFKQLWFSSGGAG